MKLNPETVLKRRSFLRLSINSSNEVQVSLNDKLIKCGLEALAIIELFSAPLSVAAAIKQLGARYREPEERVAAIATLFRLHESGVLRDVAARDDLETARVTAGDANAVANGDESGKNFAPDEIYFECPLDEPAHGLIPYRGRDTRARGRTPPPETLTLNPAIALQTGDEVPAHLSERLLFLDRFSPRRPLLWVEDEGTQFIAPYWLNPRQAKLIERLKSKEIAPAELEPEIVEQFTRAQILVAAGEAKAQVWQRACEELRRDLQTEQHAVLRKIIHPLQLAALRGYFRALDAQGQLRASSNKHYAHNRRSIYDEETARFVQRQITPLVNRITPAPVRPSHSQVSIYRPGAFLRRHKDQPQYVWNLSLVLDAEPELEAAQAWPICLEVAGEPREVRLEIGDAVLYRGSEFTHWRDVLPDGQSVTLLFCFFSPANDYYGFQSDATE